MHITGTQHTYNLAHHNQAATISPKHSSSGRLLPQHVEVSNATTESNKAISTSEVREKPTSPEVHSDTVSISRTAQQAETKWQEISDKYNVTNISGHEVMAMAKELYDNNLISGSEMLDMFRPSGINEDLSAPRNHLENMRNDLEMMKQYGNNSHQAIQSASKIVNILQRIG